MNWTKYSGYLLCATGVIHNIIGIMLGWSSLQAMHDSGWWASTVVDGQYMFDRAAIVWFLTLGSFWIVLGLALQSALDQGVTISPLIGWSIVLIAAAIIVVEPQSGAYLVLLQGIFMVLGNRRKDIRLNANFTKQENSAT